MHSQGEHDYVGYSGGIGPTRASACRLQWKNLKLKALGRRHRQLSDVIVGVI